MADYGLSTLGITLWAAESANGAKVTTAASYSQLTRINSIGELSLEANNIDASALEDYVTHYVAGRSDVSDTYPITINLTNETVAEWEALLGKKVCFLASVPGLTKQIFVIATVPKQLPAPALDQNGLLTATINCTTNDFIGIDTAVSVVPTTVTLSRESVSVAEGSTVSVSATVDPAGGTVVWSSSDTSVADVDGGVITGVAEGEATIKAKCGGAYDTCVVTVTAAN